MKNLILIFLLSTSTIAAFAQANSDSVAYQYERKKINNMLAQRALKFGQYDQSLSMHTGIFGLQTKKDIRRSNDILMDIVKTDNNIYKELKILLEYRTFQQKQVQTHSKEAEGNTLGYMNTINKLRQQLVVVTAENGKQQQQYEKTKNLFIIAIILMLASILFLATRLRSRKA